MAEIEVVTLGRLAVAVDGTEAPGVSTRPVRAALLVYLSVESTPTRDAAVACLWPDRAPDRARHALNQTLYQLRRDFGRDWVVSDGTYLRRTDRVAVDVDAFTRAIGGGRWQAALDLYGGRFLESCYLVSSPAFQQWTDLQSARLEVLHRQARVARLEELTGHGRLADAVRCAREWSDRSPLEDEPVQHTMRLHVRLGDRAAALHRFDAFLRLLESEELDPLPETVALAREVREAPPAVATRGGLGTQRIPRAAAPADGMPSSATSGDGGGAPPSRPAGVPTDPLAPTPAPSPRPGGRFPMWTRVLAAGAVLALGAAAVALLSRPEPTAGPAPAIRSVGVLPPRPLDGGELREYVMEGVHEGLIRTLARHDRLRVIARGSMVGFGPSGGRPASRIAREIGVDAVVETTMRRAGDSVWIRVDLVDATDRLVGSASEAGRVGEIPSLLGRLADALVERTGSGPVPGADSPSPPLPPVDRVAFERYLEAEHLVRELRTSNWVRAAELYESAIAADSSFAPAYAGVAVTHFAAGLFGAAPRSVAWPEARAWATRALARDSALAGAHTVLGFVALYDDWDWRLAEAELLEALRLDRNDVLARHAWADLLTLRGEADEGLRQVELARSVDPLSPLATGPVIGHLHFARRFEDVIAEVSRQRELFHRPRFGGSFMAAALWQLGTYEAALAEFRDAYGWTSDGGMTATVDRGFADGGPRGAMRAAADYSARRWRPGDGTAYRIAELYSRAGAVDEGFFWLERAYEERPPAFLHFTGDPVFDPLRRDPRFTSLLARVGVDPATGR